MVFGIGARYKSVREFYDGINELIASLKNEQKMDDALRVNKIMNESVWTTSSEAIGELSLVLRTLKGRYSPATKRLIKDCREFASFHRWILGLS